ncbi:hypothetical protein STW0522PSE72_37050 [Pseudomonas monteilii]|nr:hypothetical protein STW0522PSE72_37050 [Pseudomonas monteilii]
MNGRPGWGAWQCITTMRISLVLVIEAWWQA